MLRLRVKQAMADAVAIGRVWRYRAGAYAPSGRVVPSGATLPSFIKQGFWQYVEVYHPDPALCIL